ncbi:hypothetical protein LJC20_06175 [Eubacteriales bacterium OttesenSCG-928-M02]|nr:hypothetical protein [Eubacteriales bacterium OttesenSCG-928-M02]
MERIKTMRTKEQYYELVLENRKLAADPKVTQCPCPNPLCEWHGRCKECVALHRYHGDHIVACLQPIVKKHAEGLLQSIEMEGAQKEGTPVEYRLYVRERDKAAEKSKE